MSSRPAWLVLAVALLASCTSDEPRAVPSPQPSTTQSSTIALAEVCPPGEPTSETLAITASHGGLGSGRDRGKPSFVVFDDGLAVAARRARGQDAYLSIQLDAQRFERLRCTLAAARLQTLPRVIEAEQVSDAGNLTVITDPDVQTRLEVRGLLRRGSPGVPANFLTAWGALLDVHEEVLASGIPWAESAERRLPIIGQTSV